MKLKKAVNSVVKEFFQAMLVCYLLLILAETLREGFVSNFFNMNYLLVGVLLCGIIMVLTESADRAQHVSKKVSRAFIRLSVISAKRARKARLAAQQQVQRFTPRPVSRAVSNKPINDFAHPRSSSRQATGPRRNRSYIDFISQ